MAITIEQKVFTLEAAIEAGVKVNFKVEDIYNQGKFKFISNYDVEFKFNDDQYLAGELYKDGNEFGFYIAKNNELVAMINIYEPGCFKVVEDRGCVVFNGHEEIVIVFVDNFEITTFYTR